MPGDGPGEGRPGRGPGGGRDGRDQGMCDHCGCRQGAIGRLMDQHDRISELAGQVRQQLAAGDEPAARATFATLRGILDRHVAWEERGLFARMTAQGEFADHVADLEADHGWLNQAITAADLSPTGWGGAVTGILDRLAEHIYREDYGLFPAAVSVLDAADWAAIDAVAPGSCGCGGCGEPAAAGAGGHGSAPGG